MYQHAHHISSALNDAILLNYRDNIEYRDKMWDDNSSSENSLLPIPNFKFDIIHLSTATVKQRAVFWFLLISSHSVPLHFPLCNSYCLLADCTAR